MSAIAQVAKEHDIAIAIVGAAVLQMWRGVAIDDLTYDMVESALFDYYEQDIDEEADEAQY